MFQYNDDLISASPDKAPKVTHVILEKDSKGKSVVEVDPALVAKLKPHQVSH